MITFNFTTAVDKLAALTSADLDSILLESLEEDFRPMSRSEAHKWIMNNWTAFWGAKDLLRMHAADQGFREVRCGFGVSIWRR